jgi:hypothetical protein
MTKLNADYRRALTLLAEALDGCTRSLLLARGYTLTSMLEMVHSGHATAQTEKVHGQRRNIVRLRITDAGRVALERS